MERVSIFPLLSGMDRGSGFDFPVRPCMAISLLVADQSAASVSLKSSRDMGEIRITMIKEMVILYKKEFRKWKKVVSLIDLKMTKTRNDFEIACDCVKGANVVLHVGLCKEIFSRKHTATHKPTSAQPLIVTTMPYTH